MNLKKIIDFFKDLEKKIPKGYLLHISNNEINYKDPEFTKIKVKQIIHMKPLGLWLSGGISDNNSWINWVIIRNEMEWYKSPTKFKYYAVKINTKTPKLLMLNTQDKLIEFHKKYRISNKKYCMNWRKLEEQGYYGVYFKFIDELADRINTFADKNKIIREMIWYVSLDCSCYCIWNNELILNITKIK